MTIPSITPMTTPVPTRADKTTFFERADVTMSEWPVVVDEMNAAIDAINSTSAAIDADATSAASSAAIAAGLADFKGQWSSLSGALAIPAAVEHNGVIYILLSNTSNVALITPGVSSQWLPVLTFPLFTLPILQANAGYAAASAMEVLGAADFDTLLTGAGSPAFGAYSGSNYALSSGASLGSVSTSPDGETWTLRTMPSTNAWGPIGSNGAGKLMCAVPNSTTVAISTNHGVTWAACAAPGGTILVQAAHGVHYVVGLWLLPVGNNNIGYHTSADDGASWTSRSFPILAPSTSEFRMVGSTLWFRQSQTSTTAYTTTDGINWTTRTASVPAGTMLTGTFPDGSLWGCIGTTLYKTTDGITWSLQTVQTQVSGLLPAEVSGVKLVLTGAIIYAHDQGAWTARARGIVSAVDLPNQWSTRAFQTRGNLNGRFMQLGHSVGRCVSIKPGSGSASGLFRKV